MRNAARPGQPWLRLAAFALALLLAMLLPFVLWGDAFDQAVPPWLMGQDGVWLIAAVGIGLLVADVALPVPSSLVSLALCWNLGPLWGPIGVAVGCWLAFATGYGIGRLVPEPRLRQWIGPALWDSAQRQARQRAMWWIVAARPLPLLAELSAVLAGVWRVPMLPALAHAAAASCVVGAMYGASVWLGRGRPALGLTLLALLALPVLTWVLHRIALRRLLTADGAAPDKHDPDKHDPDTRVRKEETS